MIYPGFVMMEKKTTVRLSGTSAEILKELVERGYLSTKSDALRARLLKRARGYWRELGLEVNRAKRKLIHNLIFEAIQKLEQET